MTDEIVPATLLVESLCASKPGCVVHGGTAQRGRGIYLYLFYSSPAQSKPY